MKFRVTATVFALCASAFGMSQNSTKVSVRFHPEANPNDGASFVMPVKLQNLRRDASLSRVPAIYEKQIKAIFPFPGDDGTWGCVFQMDEQGRIRLETMSSEQMHTALVLFVSTKGGQHQVIDMLIDKPVTNGIISIPRGLTELEVNVLKTQFPIIGEEKGKKKKAAQKPDEVTAPAPTPAPRTTAPKTTAPRTQPVPKDKLRELDLPRVAD